MWVFYVTPVDITEALRWDRSSTNLRSRRCYPIRSHPHINALTPSSSTSRDYSSPHPGT